MINVTMNELSKLIDEAEYLQLLSTVSNNPNFTTAKLVELGAKADLLTAKLSEEFKAYGRTN